APFGRKLKQVCGSILRRSSNPCLKLNLKRTSAPSPMSAEKEEKIIAMAPMGVRLAQSTAPLQMYACRAREAARSSRKYLSCYERRSQNMNELIGQLFLNGISTRKLEKIAQELMGVQVTHATRSEEHTSELQSR